MCDCYATITDTERKKLFEGVFPDEYIPISNPLPAGRAKTGREVYTFYQVDKARLTPEMKHKIAERVGRKFSLSIEQVLKDMEDPEYRIPLKGDGLVITFCRLHSRMIL
ncbi:MAG: hypothetical protein ACRECH_18345 [Nitrososphaerales archaeon]